MSKSHIAKTFIVANPDLPMYLTFLSAGMETLTWVPSNAPMQSLKCG
jgi:hypothetical protein